MNGDKNNESKKKEMKHRDDENVQTGNAKKDDESSIENKDKSEELEILEDLPPKAKKIVEAMFSMESIARPGLSHLESKINEKHIDKILEIKEKYDDKVFSDTQQSRKFLLLYILIGVSLFVFLTLFLVGKDTELFKEIIKLFIAFVGGMGAGVGIKHYMDNK